MSTIFVIHCLATWALAGLIWLLAPGELARQLQTPRWAAIGSSCARTGKGASAKTAANRHTSRNLLIQTLFNQCLPDLVGSGQALLLAYSAPDNLNSLLAAEHSRTIKHICENGKPL